MNFILAKEGTCYTPPGHDAQVFSRIIYKKDIDIHETIFPPYTGMEEEVHEDKSHVFFVMRGKMDVLQEGRLLKSLGPNDAVYIPKGERHEIKNTSETDMAFLAITFLE